MDYKETFQDLARQFPDAYQLNGDRLLVRQSGVGSQPQAVVMRKVRNPMEVSTPWSTLRGGAQMRRQFEDLKRALMFARGGLPALNERAVEFVPVLSRVRHHLRTVGYLPRKVREVPGGFRSLLQTHSETYSLRGSNLLVHDEQTRKVCAVIWRRGRKWRVYNVHACMRLTFNSLPDALTYALPLLHRASLKQLVQEHLEVLVEPWAPKEPPPSSDADAIFGRLVKAHPHRYGRSPSGKLEVFSAATFSRTVRAQIWPSIRTDVVVAQTEWLAKSLTGSEPARPHASLRAALEVALGIAGWSGVQAWARVDLASVEEQG